MGNWKLLMDFKGKSLIKHALDNAFDCTGRIIVVGGYKIDELRVHLRDYINIKIVENPDYKQGMITSVQKALPYVHSQKFFVSLADMPLIPPEIYSQMSKQEFPNALFPVFKKRRGHPVLLDGSLKKNICEAGVDMRMKKILSETVCTEFEVNTSGILFDIDTAEDYRKIIKGQLI